MDMSRRHVRHLLIHATCLTGVAWYVSGCAEYFTIQDAIFMDMLHAQLVQHISVDLPHA